MGQGKVGLRAAGGAHREPQRLQGATPGDEWHRKQAMIAAIKTVVVAGLYIMEL